MSTSRFSLSEMSRQLPSSRQSHGNMQFVSTDTITKIAMDVLTGDDDRRLGMAEDELIRDIANALHDLGKEVSDSRIRDVIEHDIDQGENFVRLLGPHGPVAVAYDIEKVVDAFYGGNEPVRLNDLLEHIQEEASQALSIDERDDLLNSIIHMTDLGYLNSDAKLYLTLRPNLIYNPEQESAMQDQEEEEAEIEVEYRPQTARPRSSSLVETPTSKRARVGVATANFDRQPVTKTATASFDRQPVTRTATASFDRQPATKTAVVSPPSPYNEFMKTEIAKVKKQWEREGRNPEVYDHKAAFKQAAFNWKTSVMNPKNQ